MATVKRRYTTSDGKNDWIVSATYDPKSLATAHWLEVQVAATHEGNGTGFKFPPEISTFRLGEIEHPFRQSVGIDFAGDQEAALEHHLGTVFRRVYTYLERGH